MILKTALTVAIVTLSFGSISYADAPLPPNLTFQASSKATEEGKSLLGVWRGDWTGGLQGALAVTKIRNKTSVEVYYAWKFKDGSNQGYDGPLNAKLKNGVLTLPKFGNGARATYYLKNDTLEGHYKDPKWGTTVATFRK